MNAYCQSCGKRFPQWGWLIIKNTQGADCEITICLDCKQPIDGIYPQQPKPKFTRAAFNNDTEH